MRRHSTRAHSTKGPGGEAASALFAASGVPPADGCSASPGDAAAYAANAAAETAQVEAEQAAANLNHLGSLKPMGQLRESFILASGEDGLWIIDQHVAHERILFEKILRDRQVERVQRQRLLMPLLVELKPWQMVVFARIAEDWSGTVSKWNPLAHKHLQ